MHALRDQCMLIVKRKRVVENESKKMDLTGKQNYFIRSTHIMP